MFGDLYDLLNSIVKNRRHVELEKSRTNTRREVGVVVVGSQKESVIFTARGQRLATRRRRRAIQVPPRRGRFCTARRKRPFCLQNVAAPSSPCCCGRLHFQNQEEQERNEMLMVSPILLSGVGLGFMPKHTEYGKRSEMTTTGRQ